MYKLAKSTESMDKKVNNLVNLFKYKFTTNHIITTKKKILEKFFNESHIHIKTNILKM